MAKRIERWRRLVAALESSGLSRAAFCRRRGLNYHTMTYWVRRLAESDAVDGGCPRPSFVELSLPAAAASGPRVSSAPAAAASGPPVSSAPTAAASETYELVLGHGRSIRLGAAFDDEAVARLVRTLESC